MKIKGKKIDSPMIEIVVLPRPDGDIVFKAQAVLDFEEFDKLVTEPTPRMLLKPGGGMEKDTNNKNYRKELDEYNTQRVHWMFIKSLEATEGLEWETVDMNDPTTWKNYESELKASNFSAMEINHITRAIMIANALDDRKLKEARDSFLAGPQVEA